MRSLLSRLALTAATVMLLSVPASADSMSGVNSRDSEMKDFGKDICLVFAMNCDGRAYTRQEKIDVLQREINKGESVYNSDELKLLQRKLDIEKRELDETFEGGA